MPTRQILTLLAVAVVSQIAGCQADSDQFTVDDLNPAERQVVTQYIVLERARVVALADPETGVASLDSLAAAWGDSAAVTALSKLSIEPARAALVHDLIQRLLEAEADSLVHAPYPRRLGQPLPEPAPVDD